MTINLCCRQAIKTSSPLRGKDSEQGPRNMGQLEPADEGREAKAGTGPAGP